MELLNKQQEYFENIKTLCTNYKKDSESRKTVDYLEKRLSALEKLWIDFHEQHEILVDVTENKDVIGYFYNDVYGKTKVMYESTKRSMMNLLVSHQDQDQKLDFELTGMLEEVSDDKTKKLMTQQECNFKALDRIMSKIDIETITERWEFEEHLSLLKSKWESIDKVHWELEIELKKGSLKEVYSRTFDDVEEKYDNIRRMLNKNMWSNKHYEESTPKLDIPVFSGDYSQWMSFKNIFSETIHNNPSMSKSQKMQHLKTKIKGEPERLIRHLSLSANNYDSSWEILRHRYDNRRLQFNSFMNTMQRLPVIQQPNAYNIKRMHDDIKVSLDGLSNMGIDVTSWGPMIVYYMSQKLDSTSINEFVKDMPNKRELPKLQEFMSFLDTRFVAYETATNCQKNSSSFQKPSSNKDFQKPIQRKSYNNNRYFNMQNYSKNSTLNESNKEFSKTFHTSFGKCPLCDGEHVLMKCDKFVKLNHAQRNKTVAKLQVCKNCLYSHGNSECRSSNTCKECNLRHHTLLHNNETKPNSQNEDNKANSRPSTSSQSKAAYHSSENNTEVLLTTVQVKIQAVDGSYITLRALLDQGSQINLITENAAQLLRLPRMKLNASVSGVGSLSGNCKGSVHLNCKAIHSEYKFDTRALVLRKLTNNLPNFTFEKYNWNHLQNLKLADPDYNVSRSIDLLLGADVYADIILDGVLKGDPHSPIAQQTRLGWILCGKLKTFNCHATLIDSTDLSKYWESEDIVQSSADINQDDQCEIFYKETTTRGPDGKYIVKMPMVQNFDKNLGRSKPAAISQFLQLEKRLGKNMKLCTMYKNFVTEYLELQHMKLSRSQITSGDKETECYLPHHGVLRDSSTTTKLRVVFNASQKTSSGKSLNNLMEKGPNLQNDIQELILKWRTYKYVFTADVEKMYRCIWIAEDQQQLQKIIWRNSPNEALQEYALRTVTYGTKCAPWLAIRTLKQLAIDDRHKYPTASKILENEFYVDDLISGHNSLDMAKEIQKELTQLLCGGGMNLRKWSSNSPELLKQINEQQISKTTFDFKHDESMKTLGLGWNSESDSFTFNWKLKENSKRGVTKRSLLSQISQLYDPLGWLSPVTITAKLIFQRVWAQKIEWDEPLPIEIQDEWLKLKGQLPHLKAIKIRRWIECIDNNIELLGFSDASEKAYSCVIYTRTINESGQTVLSLLVAKTRVAPLAQKLSLPRLELCGALLLSHLMKKVIDALKGYNMTISAWCDSKVVLAWIQGTGTQWERYIENRVLKIRQIIQPSHWSYIESKNNPADCATRGLYPHKLFNNDLWWTGPAILQTFSRKKPRGTQNCLFSTKIGENQTVPTLQQTENNIIYNLLHKHSTMTRVVRVVAWILRFRKNKRNNDMTTRKLDANRHAPMYCINVSELDNAIIIITKNVQRYEFEKEHNLLSKKQALTNKSSLYKLNPYLDEDGIMRVGGRLNKTNLPPGTKNPIIVSRRGRLTQLLIDEAHVATLHGGARLTLAYLRQRYWIVGGNRAVKTQLHRCVRCHRFKLTNNYQVMADLPSQRVTPSRPFTHTGVDYTGHVEVKLNKGKGVKTSKGYIAIFICMATKAVHIELVSDLGTETFLAAFQRMCSRRGIPKHVYSDCGTNFIGASKMLNNEYEAFQKELPSEFFDEINKMKVEWHFNAPSWPTAGGIWEAAVRSMKHHLRRVLGDQKLTYEEFATLLTNIEACMNSRPLCPLTEDPDEFFNYLTPGHFLTGSPTLTLPLSNYEDDRNLDLRRRWQLTENMFQRFWKTWSSDYLTSLQSRSKWQKSTPNLKETDVVLVKENNLPPGKWAMGRVVEVHPGADGHVRVATIKTQAGIMKRPITKLSLLPITTENIINENSKSTL